MVASIRFVADFASERKRPVLEEIIRNTTIAIEEQGLAIEISFEREEQPTFFYEGTGAYAYAEFDEERRQGSIILSRYVRNTLSDTALKGLIYHMIGEIIGRMIFYENEWTEEAEALKEILLGTERTPEREALFDFLMLQKGGTIEALVAYKTETTIAAIKEVDGKEDQEFNYEAFERYCNTLKTLHQPLGNLITTLVEMRTRRYQKPHVETYEN